MAHERLFSRALVRIAAQDGAGGERGDDPAAFLQALLTNDVAARLPIYAGLLTPQGKTLFDLIVWPAADGALLLDCEAATADELVQRLTLYRLRRRIAIKRDDSLGVYWQAQLGDGGSPDPRLADLGQRWIAAASEEDVSADEAWLRHRLSLGVPEGRSELGEVLWLETNAVELNGVSFSKGCYVGQENTARMNWRQKVNRRLLVVPLAQSHERRKAAHPDAGFAIDHRRVEDIADELRPGWMVRAPAA